MLFLNYELKRLYRGNQTIAILKKTKINENTLNKINEYLNHYSKVSSDDDKIRYLEQTKKFIYNKYIDENNKKHHIINF